ncbi:zf-HC2 domain-containing protein [Dictyobacter arantiisoli]|uniref:Putative zinc-finger domain-containing protein n=1 Tax=Dictyobacter arantiisoli TaxID=2014874 RepID=A0A5A5THA7_9CHLR|nr:zf-HC2 domain-containing protein [Dictyobacter arantiisoli]GCF10598.1 hypothetical protein KDI_41620 [Dictyobacter arantiisoli]
MRCRDAKEWLSAQRDGELDPSDSSYAKALQEHLSECASCRTFAHQQQSLDAVFSSFQVTTTRTATSETPVACPVSISTDKIMRAIQQQNHITHQLEDLRQQQKSRIERFRTAGAVGTALGLLTLSSIPLLFLIITLLQTDLALKMLAFFNGAIDEGIVFGQYTQTGLTLVTRDNWLLSALGFAVVVMMGMWLRLMRPPQEA